mmetsp:Transcript_6849/g.20159  ORF Transcript_6849/g.20159 Transcript_6849/m.20159 type:complete len:398 (+) Transcript_6849:359-1552(+)
MEHVLHEHLEGPADPKTVRSHLGRDQCLRDLHQALPAAHDPHELCLLALPHEFLLGLQHARGVLVLGKPPKQVSADPLVDDEHLAQGLGDDGELVRLFGLLPHALAHVELAEVVPALLCEQVLVVKLEADRPDVQDVQAVPMLALRHDHLAREVELPLGVHDEGVLEVRVEVLEEGVVVDARHNKFVEVPLDEPQEAHPLGREEGLVEDAEQRLGLHLPCDAHRSGDDGRGPLPLHSQHDELAKGAAVVEGSQPGHDPRDAHERRLLELLLDEGGLAPGEDAHGAGVRALLNDPLAGGPDAEAAVPDDLVEALRGDRGEEGPPAQEPLDLLLDVRLGPGLAPAGQERQAGLAVRGHLLEGLRDDLAVQDADAADLLGHDLAPAEQLRADVVPRAELD